MTTNSNIVLDLFFDRSTFCDELEDSLAVNAAKVPSQLYNKLLLYFSASFAWGEISTGNEA